MTLAGSREGRDRDEDALAFLRAENCDFAQGHLFGDPMTGEEFCEVLVADNEGTGKYRTLFA